MAEEDPERRDWADHTAEFRELVRSAHLGEDIVRTEAHWTRLLMKVRNDELVLLAQGRPAARMSVYQEAVAAEVARRNVVALDEFKKQSKVASDRLETLTRWLIVFTAAVVLLTVVLVAHDLTR
jgi:hypothetical protein